MRTFAIGAVLGLLLASACASSPFPEPVGIINDFAHVLTPDARGELETLLRVAERESAAAIVVVSAALGHFVVLAIGGLRVNRCRNRCEAPGGHRAPRRAGYRWRIANRDRSLRNGRQT